MGRMVANHELDGPWVNTMQGRAVSLIAPRVTDIDFAEIIETLSGVYRWAGSAQKDVSVAFHTLICLHCVAQVVDEEAARSLAPYVLLHDFHEAFIGDITTPAVHALALVADQCREPGKGAATGYPPRLLIFDALFELKHRFDLVIHEAAGLPMPDAPMRRAIRAIDMMALKAERAAFLRTSGQSWGHEIENAPILQRMPKWQPKDRNADALALSIQSIIPATRAHFRRGI